MASTSPPAPAAPAAAPPPHVTPAQRLKEQLRARACASKEHFVHALEAAITAQDLTIEQVVAALSGDKQLLMRALSPDDVTLTLRDLERVATAANRTLRVGLADDGGPAEGTGSR